MKYIKIRSNILGNFKDTALKTVFKTLSCVPCMKYGPWLCLGELIYLLSPWGKWMTKK